MNKHTKIALLAFTTFTVIYLLAQIIRTVQGEPVDIGEAVGGYVMFLAIGALAVVIIKATDKAQKAANARQEARLADLRARYPEDVVQGILGRYPVKGMDVDAVLGLWGKPHTATEKQGTRHIKHDWTYYRPDGRTILRKAGFKDGILETWEIR